MEKIKKFLVGINGLDSFSGFILLIALILNIISYLIKAQIMQTISILIFIYGIYRIFSKNTYKRQRENQMYAKINYKVRQQVLTLKNLIFGTKTHKYFKCPSCGTNLRIPRNKGTLKIKCPKCSNTFYKKS